MFRLIILSLVFSVSCKSMRSNTALQSQPNPLTSTNLNFMVYDSPFALEGDSRRYLNKNGFQILFIPGDLDFDGQLTEEDLSILRGFPAPDQKCEKRLLDVNEDGAIDQGDYDYLYNLITMTKQGAPIPVRMRYSLGGCPLMKITVARPGCRTLEFKTIGQQQNSIDLMHVTQTADQPSGFFTSITPPMPGMPNSDTNEKSYATSLRNEGARFVFTSKGFKQTQFDINVGPFSYSLMVGELGQKAESCARQIESTKSIIHSKENDLPLPSGTVEYPNDFRFGTIWQQGSPKARISPTKIGKRKSAPVAEACLKDNEGKRKGEAFAIQLLSDWRLEGNSSAGSLDNAFRSIAHSLKISSYNDVYWNISQDDRLRFAPKRNQWCKALSQKSWTSKGKVQNKKGTWYREVSEEHSGAVAEGSYCFWQTYTLFGNIKYSYAGKVVLSSNYASKYASWKKDVTLIQQELDDWLNRFVQRIKAGTSSAFFYIGSHGSPPSKEHPYGYWSAGVSGRSPEGHWMGLYLDRDKVLSRIADAARQAKVCDFTAIDDACYGQIAKWGREKASSCMDRPARFVGKEKYPVNLWLSMAHAYRTARNKETLVREKEIARHLRYMKNYPTQFNWDFKTVNFGDVYSDHGNNDKKDCPWPP